MTTAGLIALTIYAVIGLVTAACLLKYAHDDYNMDPALATFGGAAWPVVLVVVIAKHVGDRVFLVVEYIARRLP